jgi:hypothetical protein
MAKKKSELATKIESKIIRAADMPANRKLLIYGRAKQGKTRLVSSAPKVLLLDINEKGTASVRRDLNPWVYPITFWTEIADIFWYLQEGNHDYESVALDGLTAMQTLCMNFVLGEQVALDASRDPDMPTRQAWGKVGQLMKTQITNYRNLPMNVIFTALTRSRFVDDEDDTESSGEPLIGPAVSPSVGNHIEQAVDLIGYLYKREVIVKSKKSKDKKKVTRRRLIVEGSERYVVGDRTGTLGTYVDAPDLTEMIAIMDEEA